MPAQVSGALNHARIVILDYVQLLGVNTALVVEYIPQNVLHAQEQLFVGLIVQHVLVAIFSIRISVRSFVLLVKVENTQPIPATIV